jgi:glycosyltransferase involved in cell wall biosynthesis
MLMTRSLPEPRSTPPGLAIIIPAYNSESTIRETLESIQAQSALSRISGVYLADDASTDNTVEEARSAWHSNVPFSVSHNTRNKGERATVNNLVSTLPEDIKWFLLLHADDIAKPNWIEVMASEIDGATPQIISLTASYDLLYEDGRIETGENFGLKNKVTIEGTPMSVRDTLERGCWFKVSSCAIQSDEFRKLGGFRTEMPQLGDWEFVLRSLSAGKAIEYIPMCLSFYRQHCGSVSSRSFREHRDVQEALWILNSFRQYLPRRSMMRRHLFYLNSLARRSVRSLIVRDWVRFRRAWAIGARVGFSLTKHAIAK